MINYSLTEETLGYNTADLDTNTDKRLLVAGSQNVLIDRQRKVRSRPGYTRLGAANTALTPIRSAITWNTSLGTELPIRVYDDELEVYLGTVDGTAINAWKRVLAGWSTTAILRFATWWDTSENIDQLLFVQGDDNLYKWGGGVVVVASVTSNTITKAGTSTFAQSRFYTTGAKTLVNIRTGTEFTYTGGESTLTLTGVSGDPTADGMVAGDILVQKVVTHADEPAANRNNDNIFVFENQVFLSSDDDEEVYISQNDDVTDYSFSSPRVSGEGALLTLDNPAKAFASLGSVAIVFAGKSSVYRCEYEQIAVGSTLAETLKVRKLDTGVNQSAQTQETVVNVGNAVIYLSFEPAVRIIQSPDDLTGINPESYSNPIKPDFDAEDWTNATAIWYKNGYYLASRVNSRTYILEFVQDADGRVRRFWDPPQILPVGNFSIISDLLYGHSNAVPETYKLFDGLSDVNSSDEKLPINCIASFAYQDYGKAANLKMFDEYYVDGEITANTIDLLLTINYDYGGQTQSIEKTIDGSDEDILEGNVGLNSLGQQSLGINPLGGLLNPPEDARKFRVIFEFPKEDFHILQPVFSSNEVDRYWAIATHGANAQQSPRRNTSIYK